MKKVSLALMAAAMLVVGTVSATPTDDLEPKKLSSQIQKILNDNDFKVDADLKANVRLIINEDGEIVVLSVKSESDRLEKFVKGRLNYKKVDKSSAKEGRVYIVPVRITA